MADGDKQYRKARGFLRLVGDEDNPTFGIAIDSDSKALHLFDPADALTNWNVGSYTHPTLLIHSVTTPATNYIKMWHDGVDANIDAVGATALNILIGGTAPLELTSDTLTLTGAIVANINTGVNANLNGFYETLTVTGNCTGTISGIRVMAIHDGSTGRDTNNFFGANITARYVHAGDRASGMMAGLQVACDMGQATGGNMWAYGINIDLSVASGFSRATVPTAFIDFQDYDSGGSYYCKSLLDIGGSGNRAAVGNKAAKKLVCNADVNGAGATAGGIQIIVNGTAMWLATYTI